MLPCCYYVVVLRFHVLLFADMYCHVYCLLLCVAQCWSCCNGKCRVVTVMLVVHVLCRGFLSYVLL